MKEITISLAPLDSTDMALVRSWRNDHKVWGTCRQYDLLSDAEQFEWFQRIKGDPSVKMYKIMATSPDLKNEGKTVTSPIGVCGFTSIDKHNRRAEFSLYLAPELHGGGLSRPALEVLFQHGFDNHGFNLIWGECFEGNHALKVFDKIGMKRDGVRRQFYFREGRFIDANLISITAEEFRAHLSSASGAGQSLPGIPDPSGGVESKKTRSKSRKAAVLATREAEAGGAQ